MPNNFPYPGYDLKKGRNIPFEEKTNKYFFSRESDIEAIKYRLRKNRIVILISKREMGKTSILKAGVIPALREGFTANFRNKWLTPYFAISGNPYKSLAAQLAKPNLLYTKSMKPEFENILYKDLESSIYNLSYICEEAENLEENNLLVTVDDFDKLFENNKESDLGINFLETLYEASQSNNIPFSTIISLRLDGSAFRFIQRDFPELINSNSYFLHRLSEVGLMDAIIKPMKKSGIDIDNGLWRRLVEDLYFDKSQLPKLQKYMALTWNDWQKNKKGTTISYKNFSNSVGKKLSLSVETKNRPNIQEEQEVILSPPNQKPLQNQVEKIYGLLDNEEKEIITKVFKSITRYEAESQQVVEHTLPMGNISKILNTDRQVIMNTIDFFGNDLLTLELISDKLSISNSDLLSEWERMKTWAIEEYRDAQSYLKLCRAASRHFQQGIEIQDIWERSEFVKYKQWFQSKEPFFKDWAVQYAPDFDIAIEFIEKGLSINTYQQEIPTPQPTKLTSSPKRKKIVIKRKGS